MRHTSVEAFEALRLLRRVRLRPQQVLDERERVVAMHRSGRNGRGHVDPRPELARERANQLDLPARPFLRTIT